jgi:CDP-6-deoxy-D-xylo-4-hexulose-3-dehydrase
MIESMEYSDPCWFSFAVMCNIPRKRVMETFEKNNIECRTIFSGNIVRHPAYQDTEMIKIGDLHNADDVMARGMFLSCHPSITEEMIKFMGDIAWRI